MEPAAAVSIRSTRWRTALSHIGSIVVLAVTAACASPAPDAGPPADGPYIAASPEAFEGRVIGAGFVARITRTGRVEATPGRWALPRTRRQ